MSTTSNQGIIVAKKAISHVSGQIAAQPVVGFKGSNMLFGSFGALGDYSSGVDVTGIPQDFSEGSIELTNSALDVSIQGEGFFVFDSSSNDNVKDISYSRAGSLRLNKDNELVDFKGNYVLAAPPSVDSDSSSISVFELSKIKVPTVLSQPAETDNINLDLNFPLLQQASDAKVLSEFDPKDQDTYNFNIKTTIFDSVGNKRLLSAYYLKPGLRRDLWNVKTNKKDVDFKNVVIDCSKVRQSNTEYDNSTAFAVFYEIDGVPVQPLNEDQTDLASSSYNAVNSLYHADDVEYDYLRAQHLGVDGYPNLIKINNTTKDNGGRLYPGADPAQVADNNFNDIRPKDYWRSHFLFFKTDGTQINSVEPLVLQPLGSVNSEYEREVVDKTSTTSVELEKGFFQPPLDSESALILFEIHLKGGKIITQSIPVSSADTEESVLVSIKNSLTDSDFAAEIGLYNLEYNVDDNKISLVSDFDGLSVDEEFNFLKIKSILNFKDSGVDSYVNEEEIVFDIDNFSGLVDEEQAWLDLKIYNKDLNALITDNVVDANANVYDEKSFNADSAGSKEDFINNLVFKLNSAIRRFENFNLSDGYYNQDYNLSDYISFEKINDSSFKLVNKNSFVTKDLQLDLQIFKQSIDESSDLEEMRNLPHLCSIKKDSSLGFTLDFGDTEAVVHRGGTAVDDTVFDTSPSVPVIIPLSAVDSNFSTFQIKFNDENSGDSFVHSQDPKYKHPKFALDSDGFDTKNGYLMKGYEKKFVPVIEVSETTVDEDFDLGADIAYSVANFNQKIKIDYGKSTMFDYPFDVFDIYANGNGSGLFSRISIEENGDIKSHYSDDSSVLLGRMPIATFRDKQALANKDDSAFWVETYDSGDVLLNLVSNRSASSIQSFGLESSNNNISSLMMDLISYQNYYNANVEALSVDKNANKLILDIY